MTFFQTQMKINGNQNHLNFSIADAIYLRLKKTIDFFKNTTEDKNHVKVSENSDF